MVVGCGANFVHCEELAQLLEQCVLEIRALVCHDLQGQPWIQITRSITNLATVATSWFLMGISSTRLEKWPIAVRI